MPGFALWLGCLGCCCWLLVCCSRRLVFLGWPSDWVCCCLAGLFALLMLWLMWVAAGVVVCCGLLAASSAAVGRCLPPFLLWRWCSLQCALQLVCLAAVWAACACVWQLVWAVVVAAAAGCPLLSCLFSTMPWRHLCSRCAMLPLGGCAAAAHINLLQLDATDVLVGSGVLLCYVCFL